MTYSIALFAHGPWTEGYSSRAVAVKAFKSALDDGKELPWFIRHPDGRPEIVSYHGDHLDWIRA